MHPAERTAAVEEALLQGFSGDHYLLMMAWRVLDDCKTGHIETVRDIRVRHPNLKPSEAHTIWDCLIAVGLLQPIPPKETMDPIAHKHAHHAPKSPRIGEIHHQIREMFVALEVALVNRLPDCRERQQMQERLMEARMWANATVAMHQDAVLEIDGRQGR